MLVRTDLGAGSRGLTTHEVAIQTRRLAQRSLTPERDVHALCRWLRCIGKEGRFLELGTSLGVTAAYMASVGWSVETWEGCPQTLMKAQEGWRLMGLDAHVQSKQDAFQNLLAGLTSEQAWCHHVDGCHEEHATVHRWTFCECLGGHCFGRHHMDGDASRLGEAQNGRNGGSACPEEGVFDQSTAHGFPAPCTCMKHVMGDGNCYRGSQLERPNSMDMKNYIFDLRDSWHGDDDVCARHRVVWQGHHKKRQRKK